MNWDLLRDMEDLRREIDRLFNDYTRPPLFGSTFLPTRTLRQFLVNISEDKDNIYVQGLSPGLDTNSLAVTVLGKNLTISGEKQAVPEGTKPEAYHRNERVSGKFSRTIELPVEVDESAVKAEYKDGLLDITLPKSALAKPRHIDIKIS